MNIKKIPRRKFIKLLLGLAVFAEGMYVLKHLVNKPKTANNAGVLYKAGNIADFKPGNVYPFTSGNFFLQCFDDGGLMAISTKCTHLGCIIQADVKNNGFVCPCHASKFSHRGEVLSPPATRPLDIFAITLKNGEVWVDIEHPQKRQEFNTTQLIYA